MKPKNKIVTKGSRILACHLLALSLLASCSQDDALPRSAGANLPSLGLSTLQATDMPADKTVTRAAGTTAYPTSKFIGRHEWLHRLQQPQGRIQYHPQAVVAHSGQHLAQQPRCRHCRLRSIRRCAHYRCHPQPDSRPAPC